MSFDTDELPPTQKGRKYEMQAQGIRLFAGLKDDLQRLDPFELARYAQLKVVDFESLKSSMPPELIAHLLGEAKDMWSGGAFPLKLPDGKTLVILNPEHGKMRQRATLMEEVSHVFLGHQPSRLDVETKDKQGNVLARDYRQEIEDEAYGTGAAALVPYRGVKAMIGQGRSISEIAKHYFVSRPLVEYRIKVSRLWELYQKNLFSGV